MTRPPRSSLPALTPAEAALLSAAAEAFADARLRRAQGAAPGWILFEAEPGGWRAWIAPLRGPGGPLRLTSDDGQVDALRAVAALEQVEPIVSALERCWAVALRPVTVEAACPAALTFEAEQNGAAIRFALHAPDIAVPLDRAPPAASRLASVPVPSRWRVRGPALPMERLARLGQGDLLLLPRACPASLDAGTIAWTGTADLNRRTLTLDVTGAPMSTDDQESWAGAKTPVDIVIDGGPIAVGRLAALAPGSVLTLDGAGDSLPVELRAAGLRIGRGELVAVGDAYGVLLTSVEPVTASPDVQRGEAAPAEAADA